jgi:hypothetical protein
VGVVHKRKINRLCAVGGSGRKMNYTVRKGKSQDAQCETENMRSVRLKICVV